MTAEELLMMSDEIETYAADDALVIDAENRIILTPAGGLLLGVESDEEAERIKFVCPRIVGDNIDLSTLQLRAIYRNANGDKDFRICTDITIDGENIRFSWSLSRKVTRYKGAVNFIICAIRTQQDGSIKNEWNTTLAEGKVLEGLEVDISEEEFEEPKDIVLQLLGMLDEKATEIMKEIDEYLEKLKIDNNLDVNSENAIQNKVVTEEFRRLSEEIVDVEEMVDNSNTGIEYLKGNFVVGLVSSDGTIDTVDTGYLCSTANKITYDRDVTITVESGYQFFLRFFNQNGTLEKTTGWSTSNHTVPKDSIFMLSIKKYPEDYTDRPVPDEMKKKLTVKTVIETRISVLEKKVDELENPKSSWNGKNWYSFGTSMSDTSFEMPYELGGVTGKYPPYLVSLSGLVHHNYAIGGSRISKSATADRNTAVQQIMNTDISNADIITLDGLVNDFAESTPIGEFGDTTDETIMGALYQFVSYAMEHSEATIVLLTDTSGKVWTTPQGTAHPIQYIPSKKNSVGLYQSDYRKAMMDFAEWFGCICIDCGSKSNINYLHPEYLQDQLHHSEKGGEQFANTIWSELKNIQPNVSVI